MSSCKVVRLSGPLRGVKPVSFGMFPLPSEWEKKEKEAFELGRKSMQGEIDTMQAEMQTLRDGLLERIANEFNELVQGIRDAMPNLIIAAVKRIWGEVTLESQHVESLFKEILKESSADEESIRVVLCPTDMDLLKKVGGKIEEQYKEILFETDETLKEGDCLIKSKFGVIDGRIETKIDQLQEEMVN